MYRPQSLELQNIGSHKHTKYLIKPNKVTVIVGDNQDDIGQKGNGSGKSYIGEGFALGLLGEPIRKVRQKEIVKDGCKSGTVKLELINLKDKSTLTIVRNFHSKGSAECFLYVGDDEVELDSVDSKNKWIIEQLDIAKTDIYDFFLITKDHYEPFFNITDGKKKVIVNRFSKADCIDQVEGPIKEDLKKIDEEIRQLQDLSLSINAKMEVYESQIEEEKEKFSEQNKQDQIDRLNDQIKEHHDALTDINSEFATIKDLLKENAEQQKETEEMIEMNNKESAQLSKKTAPFEQKLDALRSKRKLIESERKAYYDENVAKMRELELARKTLVGSVNKFKVQQGELDAQLAGTVECPNCSHHFSVSDEDFDYKKAQKDLKHIVKRIEELNNVEIPGVDEQMSKLEEEREVGLKDFDDLLDKNDKSQESIREQMKDLQESISENISVANELNTLKHELNSQKVEWELQDRILRKKKDEHILEIDRLTQEIKEVEQSEYDGKELEQKISQCEEKIKELLDKIDDKEAEKVELESWLINFKNFKTYLANQSIKNIEDYTNLFLEQIESGLRVSIDGYKSTSTGKLKEEINITVLRDGFEVGTYGKFSGGEKSRLDICCILAIQELINTNSQCGLDLLLCDEIIDSIDSYGLECIVKGLENTQKTIQMISQHHLNSLANNTIIVQKINKISKIL